VRRRLIELWREALAQHTDPVLAWDAIQSDPQKRKATGRRGVNGFIRSNWKELNQLIAAANVWTIKNYGPDRVAGFPYSGDVDGLLRRRHALSFPAGRYLPELLRLVLRPAAGSPMTWGEQTDVPESADWYNSSYIIAWGSNVPQTRTPDAHFFTEVRYKAPKPSPSRRTSRKSRS
jgi:nitrate reductase alpha subunit